MFSLFKRKISLPTPEWIEKANKSAEFTPDYPFLSKAVCRRLFVYNDMQCGHPRNETLSLGAARLCSAFTAGNFSVWTKKLGTASFPVALETKSELAVHVCIKGELWAVLPDHFLFLDKQMQNGVQFARLKVPVVMSYRPVKWVHGDKVTGEEQQAACLAYMYVGIQSFWNDLLDGGYVFSPTKHFEPNNNKKKSYYYFTRLEYERK